MEPVLIDGSQGEGGGQILRTSLTLSLCLGRPVELVRIRARRDPPGLRRQHLAAVRAAAAVGGARVEGAELGSQRLRFVPGPLRAGRWELDIGSAGSTTLVLQTLLPALLRAPGPCELLLRGGTHNPWAPTYHFLAEAYLPLLQRMGAQATLALERYGFYPRGGGLVRARTAPSTLRPLELLERGPVAAAEARAVVSRLPEHVARRELAVLEQVLPGRVQAVAERVEADGPGNACWIALRCRALTELFAGIGRRGVPAEQVAGEAAAEARAYLAAGVPVGPHLADQLLLPLALAGGGRFRTVPPTAHTLTNLAVLRRFLPLETVCRPTGEGWEIAVRQSAEPGSGPP
ncbi:MAG: RNA 3'-terminal phosphate cyclase [Gammaproteobacteria bacterium]|nr:MAG: RNA 3'-terminal phosphate cyclase [Gammaproteobacteria bacterium]